jgi:hypothetical protein
MSNEQFEERERRSPLDKLGSVAGAALAVGAGAALLYRGGGNKLLSEGVRKFEGVLGGISDDLSQIALKDLDAERIRNIYQKNISNSDSTLKAFDDRLSLRYTNNNLFGLISEALETDNNPAKILSKMYDEQRISTPLKNIFGNTFSKGSKDTQHSINNFVDNAVNDIDKFFYAATEDDLKIRKDALNEQFAGTGIAHEDQMLMLNEITRRLDEKKGNFDQFMEQNKAIVDQARSILMDKSELKKTLGSVDSPTSAQKVTNAILGDKAATVQDILDEVRKLREDGKETTDVFNDTKMATMFKGNIVTKDIFDQLEEMVSKDSEYGNLFVDNTLRKGADGKLYSFAEAAKYGNASASEFANTILGKLLKTRDVIQAKQAPNFLYVGAGKADPILSSMEDVYIDGVKKNTTITSNRYMKIHDKTYKILDTPDTEGNMLQHISSLDNMYLQSGAHGTTPRLIKSMSGDMDRGKTPSFKIFKKLDMFTSATPNEFDEIKKFLGKSGQERWGKNLINQFLYPDTKKALTPKDELDNLSELNKIFRKTSSKLSKDSAKKLANVTPSGSAKRIFEMLGMSDEEIVRRLMNVGEEDGSFALSRLYNSDLNSMLKRYMKDSNKTKSILQITTNRDLFLSETKSHNFMDLLRRELGKEAFLQHYGSRPTGLDGLIDLIEGSGIKGADLKNTKYLMNWSVFQNKTGMFTSAKGLDNLYSLESIPKISNSARTLFAGNVVDGEYSTSGRFTKQFRENMKIMAKESFPLTQRGYSEAEQEVVHGHNFGEWMYMRKSVSPMDVLKDINNKEKWKAFGKQFYAGRNNMKDVTTATLFPYFGLIRLVDPLSSLGLGFSAASTGSVGDLAKNIMLKRVLPVAGVVSAYQYLDYRAKAYTGTSITGAFANSIAATDLGIRKAIDAVGLGDHLKSNKLANPMMQYITGTDTYQNYEERKEYYQNGYDPVRKGRWWSFGSASEIQGGKIDYFQPNFLKRANSDWYNVGVYGSSDEKWRHSIIPTPRHPLSTLTYLLDPYWLERKHYWDRPYPMSGKMFEEGSPWGAILNPTIGEIIKPQRKMHQSELGGTLTDVRNLIAERNRDTKEKASYMKITQSGEVTPISFTSIANADPSQQILNIHSSGNGKVSAQYLGNDFGDAATNFKDYQVLSNAYNYQMNGAVNGLTGGVVDLNSMKIPTISKLATAADAGGIIGGVVNKITDATTIDVRAEIAKQNRATLMKASKKSENGVVTPQPIFSSKRSLALDALGDEETLADIRNTSSTKDFLRDAGYSARELGGIYGFMFEELMPGSGRKSSTLQNAGRMSSVSRRFWDASVGGLGGELMEIGRRFIPHEDHGVERINPIKNTMPAWMPTRFQEGDPYQKLPKGEMRLPGAGYETLNKLHPDQYGRYGAFDRMKILADIAPWSSEYKLWRSIASKTIEDPVLKKEMKNIRTRVSQQSKTHKFYDYRFKDVEMDRKKGTVDKIISDSAFTLVGDDQIYRLAGIKVTKDQNGAGLERFMAPGSNVTVKYGSNKYKKNQDGSLSSIVTIDGENLNKKLVNNKMAELKTDYSPAGTQFMLTDGQIETGKIIETIAHAPIPFFHAKYMRVETPLESYKREHVYGNPYATWSHPIKGYLQPTMQQAWANGYLAQAIGLSTWVISHKVNNAESTGKFIKIAANTAFALTNPGAFAGGVVGFGVRMGKSPWMKYGANIGAAAGLAGFAMTRLDNPIASAGNFAVVGALIAKQLNFKNVGTKQGALLGAAVGVGLSAMKNPDFDVRRMFGPYIPKDVKKRWEIEEYYDRMKYLKYMGLYEKASRKAFFHEGVNIKKIMNKYDRDVNKREKIKDDLLAYQEKISNTYSEGDPRREEALADVKQRLSALQYPTQILKAGKYTQSAIAYKHAADSTMYGLKEGATWMNVMRAVPKTDRDFLLEFAKEKDPKKQREILKYMSPYERRILQGLWGMKQDKLASNQKFFATHQLPGATWAGWRPDVDLEDVEIKTIKNEGMLLSDFGLYESQSQTYESRSAPTIDFHQQQSTLGLQRNLVTVLNGSGLLGVDVSVTPSDKPGIQMAANIVRVTDYQIKQGINNIFGRVFY